MNERIRELAEQADIKFSAHWQHQGIDTAVIIPTDLKKFAELIVEECAKLCDRFQARDVGMQPAECAGAIRLMFGVEE